MLGEVRLDIDWQGMEMTYNILELARLEALGPHQETKAAKLSCTGFYYSSSLSSVWFLLQM